MFVGITRCDAVITREKISCQKAISHDDNDRVAWKDQQGAEIRSLIKVSLFLSLSVFLLVFSTGCCTC